jgi:hypothetical protein
MNDDQIVAALIVLGSYVATEACKMLFRGKMEIDAQKINALVAAGIGAGVLLLKQGETLDKVIYAAAAALISASGAAAIHRVGDGLRAYKERG